MWICNYVMSKNIDIEFEDGYITKHRDYYSFKKGSIINPNFKNPSIKDKIGESIINNQGLKMKIIKYNNNKDIDILFEDGIIIKNKFYKEFKNGTIKNPYYPDVFGVGYIGEGEYKSFKYDKNTVFYKKWYSMLKRCYDKEFHKKNPTYKDCSVCKEWHCFQNFAKWCEDNYYEIDGERMCLDKDILEKGNKIYSPNTCIFVPEKINTLFTKRKSERGNFLIGVFFHKKYNKFSSSVNKNGNHKFLGYYKTELDAFKAYKKEKENVIKEIADEYKNRIPKILYDTMYNYEVEIDD